MLNGGEELSSGELAMAKLLLENCIKLSPHKDRDVRIFFLHYSIIILLCTGVRMQLFLLYFEMDHSYDCLQVSLSAYYLLADLFLNKVPIQPTPTAFNQSKLSDEMSHRQPMEEGSSSTMLTTDGTIQVKIFISVYEWR